MPDERLCRNCQTPLQGEYCYHCGQREGRRDRLFSEAVGEAVGDLFNWDSRFWRTLLPLLLRPGFLTAQFIAGRRARYVPPFRLYLVISFITFLVLAFNTGEGLEIAFDDEEAAAALGSGSTEEERPRANGDSDGDSSILIAPIKLDRGVTEDGKESGGGDQVGTTRPGIDVNIDPNDPSTPPWLARWARRLETNADRVSEDPRLFVNQLLEYLPQIMFVMLPLFALLLRLCYVLSPFHYLQHLVFTLHYHSFVYLLYLLAEGLEVIAIPATEPALLLLVAYLPLALRKAYGSSIPGALAKSALVYLLYLVLLLVGMVLLAVLAVALL